MGIVHDTAGCAAHFSYVLHLTEPAGWPMPNTDESNNCSVPPRAPTMRSVPRMVPAKDSRTPARTFSTPTSNVTDNAMDATVRAVVSARFRNDLMANEMINTLRRPPCCGRPR